MKIKNLTFSYKNLKIFDSFNFESDASIIIFKGPSGCGKTTLLKIISKNLSVAKAHIQYEKNTYFVIQEDSLLPWLTGEENILNFLNVNKDSINNSSLFHIIESFYLKKVYELSYGQRRMIELFRAILYKPKLLLLDEPFNFLDKKGRGEFGNEILNLVNNGTKVILTTHYNEDISEFRSEVFLFTGIFPINSLQME